MQPCYTLISYDPEVQLRYEDMRRAGESHVLAEMLALQCPPQSTGTDSVFMQGRCNGNQFEGLPHIGNLYKAEATAAGVDISGKVYLGGLARYPGDPEAWVSGRGDVQRICETRGWGCKGAVNVKAAPADGPPAEVGLADDIVDGEVADIIEHVPAPERKRVDVTDLREQVRDRRTPRWSKNK